MAAMGAHLDELSIPVTTYPRLAEPKGKTGHLSWSDLCRHLAHHDERGGKDGKLWSPVSVEPCYRKDDHVTAIGAIVADIDDYSDPDEYLSALDAEDYAYLAYSTYTNHSDRPKFRVVLPLARLISKDEHPFVWRAFAGLYGHMDPVCKDRSRAYFLPACPPPGKRDCEPWVRTRDGDPVDPDLLMALPVAKEAPSPPRAIVPFPVNGHRPDARIILKRSLAATEGKARHYRGFHLAEQLRDNRYSETEAEPVVLELQQELQWQGDHPYSEREALASLAYAYRQPVRDPWPDQEWSRSTTETTKPPPEGNYVVSVVGFQQDSVPDPIPDLAAEALYGLAGDATDAITPCTESCPAAVLVSFLIGAGCLIGQGPHVYRDGAYHGVNEFACLVGLSASSRKGTASRRAAEVLAAVGDLYNISQRDILSTHDMHEARARSWKDLLLPGLGSGEALVAALADAVRAGAACPRRLVFEEEFSKPLRIMQREGSTLSETLRAAWDGSILANVTKAKTLRVASAHVSILAHITENEMKARLGATEMFNGFANRFLWICTKRARMLPFGGGEAPTAPIVSALREALILARQTKRVEFDAKTKEIWDQGRVYALLCTRPPGLLGAVTSRAEVHVTRLALLYALLDGAHVIRVPHLMAALALWDFSERSAAYLFGCSTGDDYADVILELLQDRSPGGMTRTEIRDGFRRNAAPGRIPTALSLLEKEGKVERLVATSDEPGRPTEYWRAKSEKAYDRNDKTPLEVARDLL